MLYDITPPITAALKVWPGDTPPSREVLLDTARGDNVTLSTLHATVHLGAHVDAPSHYGPARLHRCAAARPLPRPLPGHRRRRRRGHLLTIDDVPTPIHAPRVIFRTGTCPDRSHFNEDFASLAPSLIDALHARGVRLIGIDTPSVDPFLSVDLPSHRTFLRHDMAILEGIDLTGVPDGDYELIALPLRLVGFDASPVRRF